MGIVLLSTAAGYGVSSATYTFTDSVYSGDGDFTIVHSWTWGQSITLPSPLFTEIINDTVWASGNARQQLWFAPSAQPSFVVGNPDFNQSTLLVVSMIFSGVDSIADWNSVISSAFPGSSTITAPDVTADADDSEFFSAFVEFNQGAPAGTWTPPGGMTQAYTNMPDTGWERVLVTQETIDTGSSGTPSADTGIDPFYNFATAAMSYVLSPGADTEPAVSTWDIMSKIL